MFLTLVLTGGNLVIAIFLLVFGLAVAYGLYTRRGSAINKHPYHNVYTGAPGADRPDEFSDFETFEYQYMGRRPRRKRRARSKPAA